MTHLAIFASGSGTNFEAITQACLDGRIKATVSLMVCDVAQAGVIARAERLSIPTFVFAPKQYSSKQAYEQAIIEQLRPLDIDLICLAGYMRIVGPTLLAAYPMRIINIHPALLPAFKGAHAVEDAVAYGVKVYGITIHYVNEELDGGRIIAQRAFEYDGHDPAEVHRLGQIIEHSLYIDTINKLICEH